MEPRDASDDLAWWQKAIVYEIYPKSFRDTGAQGTGTLRGIIGQLDYLASLGVGAIWLTPIYRSPMKDNGYDVQDYYAIDPRFGTMDDMDELIAKADALGMKVVMDLVFNHTSDQCAWFLDSKASRTSEKADWYIWRDAKDGKPPTNWRSAFGGSAWRWSDTRKQYCLHTFGASQPDLNWENPDVREALYDVAKFWLDKGVGGFRVDAIVYIKKPAVFVDGTPDAADGTIDVRSMTTAVDGILDFLTEFKWSTVAGRDVFTVAEANGIPPEDLPRWIGRDGVFDMLFGFDHIHVPVGKAELWCYSVDWKLTDLKDTISSVQKATEDDGWYPIFFENHDHPRSVNNFFAPDADTVSAAKAMGMVLLTLRGTPFIYQGEELGCTNGALPSIDDYDDVLSKAQYDFALSEGFSTQQALAAVQRFSRDNARAPMPWDVSEHAGFSTVEPWLPLHGDFQTCNVASQNADAASVLSWYRKLAALRSSMVELTAGDYRELLEDSQQIYAYARTANGKTAIVLVNFTTTPAYYDESLVESATLVTSSYGESQPGALQPLEAVLYER